MRNQIKPPLKYANDDFIAYASLCNSCVTKTSKTIVTVKSLTNLITKFVPKNCLNLIGNHTYLKVF